MFGLPASARTRIIVVIVEYLQNFVVVKIVVFVLARRVTVNGLFRLDFRAREPTDEPLPTTVIFVAECVQHVSTFKVIR